MTKLPSLSIDVLATITGGTSRQEGIAGRALLQCGLIRAEGEVAGRATRALTRPDGTKGPFAAHAAEMERAALDLGDRCFDGVRNAAIRATRR